MTQTQVKVIGSLAMAERVLRHHTNEAPDESIKTLGSGSFRTAYLAPDGFVYKVPRTPWGGSQSEQECENADEYREALDTEKFPNWVIPHFAKYRMPNGKLVIAMEHFEGSHAYAPAYCPEKWKWEHPIGYTHDTRACDKGCAEWQVWQDEVNGPANEFAASIEYYDMHERNFIITPDGKNVLIDCG